MRKLGMILGSLVVMMSAGVAEAAETSTIVIDAKDDAGHDIGDATVAIDGVVVASSVDGHELTVDVGPHKVAVTHNGVTKTEDIIAKAGEQDRQIHVTFGGGVLMTIASDPSVLTPGEDKHRSVGPIIVMGAGGAALLTGIIVFATAPKMPSNCNSTTELCQASFNDGQGQLPPSQLAADQRAATNHDTDQKIGAALMVGGAAVAVGGLVWYLLDKPTKPRTAMIAPWLSAGSGGLSAAGTF